jgi:hypothetical protein
MFLPVYSNLHDLLPSRWDYFPFLFYVLPPLAPLIDFFTPGLLPPSSPTVLPFGIEKDVLPGCTE